MLKKTLNSGTANWHHNSAGRAAARHADVLGSNHSSVNFTSSNALFPLCYHCEWLEGPILTGVLIM